MWGERDSIIPVAHGAAAHEAMPGSRFEVFDGAGHMPHDDDPFRFASLLREFCDTTEGARLEHDHWQPLLGDSVVSAARLSALDASFLAVESAATPMHVGWVASYDGPGPGFAALRDHLAERLEGAPRYRQKLAPVPFGLHEPVWVDDPAFDPAEHLLHAEGDDLGAIVDTILSTPLPRDRPLWQMWIADELPGGRLRGDRQDAPLHGRRRRDRRAGPAASSTRSRGPRAATSRPPGSRCPVRRRARASRAAPWTAPPTARALVLAPVRVAGLTTPRARPARAGAHGRPHLAAPARRTPP